MKKILFIIISITTSLSFSQEKDSINNSDNNKTELVIREQKARFPGGQKEMISFIQKNLIIPDELKKDNIKGTVIIGFTIDRTGKVIDIKILKSLREDLDKLAIAVIEKMPLWEPAIIRGFKVKASGQKLPFRFNLPME